MLGAGRALEGDSGGERVHLEIGQGGKHGVGQHVTDGHERCLVIRAATRSRRSRGSKGFVM